MRKRGGGKGTNEREKAKTGALFNIKVQSVNTFVFLNGHFTQLEPLKDV